MPDTAVRLIPALIPQICNGCMECVANCTNDALFGRVVDRTTIMLMLAKIERPDLRDALKSRFVPRVSFHGSHFPRNGSDMVFSLFVDVDKCQGCGDCVTACEQVHALELVPAEDLWLEELHFDLFRHLPDSKLSKVA